jgi:hypothetical protein
MKCSGFVPEKHRLTAVGTRADHATPSPPKFSTVVLLTLRIT